MADEGGSAESASILSPAHNATYSAKLDDVYAAILQAYFSSSSSSSTVRSERGKQDISTVDENTTVFVELNHFHSVITLTSTSTL